MAARHRVGSASTYRYEDLVADAKIFPTLACITGHSLKPFIDFREFEPRLKWFTFLRDPVKRFISHYVHQRTSGIERYQMDLNQWAATFNRTNTQVQWVAGECDLDAAQQILEEKFSFVGFTETFEKSMTAFVNEFKLSDLNCEIRKRLMTGRDNRIRDEILEHFDRYQRHDCCMY